METTQEERNMAQGGYACVDTVRRLASDADRLSWSEELLRQSWYYVEKGHPSLADKIDAFLSDGSE